MKHSTFLICLFLFTLTTNAFATGDCGCKDSENALKDGSFENLDAWKRSEGTNFRTDDAYNICGQKNGLIDQSGFVYQDVAISGGPAIHMSVYGGTHDNRRTHQFYLLFYKSNGEEIENSRVTVDMNYQVKGDGKLNQYTLSKDHAPANAVKVRFGFYSSGAYFKVDVACMSISGPPLPVTLSAFNVSKEGSAATLAWSTTSESNSDRFEVQHSVDGKQWDLLATIAAQGESKELVSYNFIHTTPSAINLYRLKMIDRDETFAFSSIKSLNFEGDSQISIYPNPTADHIVVNSNATISSVKLYDQKGVLVMNTLPDASNAVDLNRLDKGIYFVKINDGSLTKRIVIVK